MLSDRVVTFSLVWVMLVVTGGLLLMKSFWLMAMLILVPFVFLPSSIVLGYFFFTFIRKYLLAFYMFLLKSFSLNIKNKRILKTINNMVKEEMRLMREKRKQGLRVSKLDDMYYVKLVDLKKAVNDR